MYVYEVKKKLSLTVFLNPLTVNTYIYIPIYNNLAVKGSPKFINERLLFDVVTILYGVSVYM